MVQKSSAAAGGTIWLGYVLTLGALLLASLAPSGRIWGINWYGYFSWYGPLVLALVGGALPLVLSRGRNRFMAPTPDREQSRPFWPIALVLTALFTAAYVLFSTRLHFLGDGYQLMASLESGVNHKPWESGTFLIQKAVYGLLGGAGEADAERALQITSCASGLLFALVSALAAVRLFSDHVRRLLYFLGVTTGGYALLFFGYIESYPLFVLAVGCYFQLGLLIARGQLSRWLALPLFAVAALFHIFTAALVPGLLYLLTRGTALGERLAALSVRTRAVLIGVTLAACGAVFAHFYYHSYFFRFTIVPLIADRFTVEGYTMFSAKHLLDYLNQIVILLPGLLVVLAGLWPQRRQLSWRQPEIAFLLLTLLPSMGLVFIFNPGLGFPRDWDLFSFVGVPLVCGSFFLLLNERSRLALGKPTALLAILLGGLVLAPRVATQAIPERAIAVFDSYSDLDAIRNGPGRYILLNYLEANGRLNEKRDRERRNSLLAPYELWDKQGQLLFREGKMAQAEERFRKAIEYAPCFAYSWANIGVCFTKREQWDSALAYLQISDALNPFNAETHNGIGWAYFNLGVLDQAEDYYTLALRYRPDLLAARANLAALYRQQGRTTELVAVLTAAEGIREAPPQAFLEYAHQLLELGEADGARRLCRRARDNGIEPEVLRQFEADHPGFTMDTTAR